jgi:hypothetical protein
VVGPLHRLGLVVALATAAGCGPQTGTGLAPLEPRTAIVGVELDVALRALGGGDVKFDFASDDLPDLTTRALRPSLTAFGGGQAEFRWTPLASDIGAHTLRFTAVASGVTAAATLQVEVVAGADPVVFVEPVGDGTTLDLMRSPCADVQLLVQDTGATQIDFSAGALWADNAAVQPDGPTSGTLHFCPSATQQQTTTIYPFTIVATDENGATAEKRYTVVLGALQPPPPPPPPTCDMTPPVITHKPHPNYTGTGNLHFYADVMDASGVYDATVFWSTSPPVDPTNPDLTAMTPIAMLQVGGTATDPSFAATLNNPNVGMPSGTATTIYYLLRATDAADAVPGCSFNTTFNPTTGVYQFVVTQP